MKLTFLGLIVMDAIAVVVSAFLGAAFVSVVSTVTVGLGPAILIAGVCRVVTLLFDMWGRE